MTGTFRRRADSDLVTRVRYAGRNFVYRAWYEVLDAIELGDVLDVGGGDFVVDVIARGTRFDSWTVVEPTVDALPNVDDPRVTLLVGDGRALDLPSDRYDTALSMQVLEHVFEPYQMLAELHRTVRPGGRIVVVVPQTANVHHAPHHYQNFTRYWVEEAARRLELDIEDYRPLGGAWSSVASRLVLQYPGALGVKGYRHPGARRGWRFWALFPVGLVLSLLVLPVAMLLSLGDMEEEANNHVFVLRKAR